MWTLSSSAVLADLDIVGKFAAIEMVLLSSMESEILHYSICYSGNGSHSDKSHVYLMVGTRYYYVIFTITYIHHLAKNT